MKVSRYDGNDGYDDMILSLIFSCRPSSRLHPKERKRRAGVGKAMRHRHSTVTLGDFPIADWHAVRRYQWMR